MTATVERTPPKPADVVGGGRFTIGERLGDGGMSLVFRARDHQLDRDVALKLLHPRYLGRPEREQRLINEAEYLRRVQGHRNLVEFVDSGRLADLHAWPWLATEVLRGKVLAWVLVRGRLGPSRTIAVARDILVALQGCHAAGIVHRDVTPNNVFELDDPRKTVKLFDFSHAADAFAPKLAVGAPERLTGVFDIPGTHGYMGPEQVSQEAADPSMDVFGFGVLLYELVTGQNPYAKLSDRGAFIRAQRDGNLAPPRLHAWAYQAPEELAEIVDACTQRNAASRPPIAELLDRLDDLDARLLDGATLVRDVAVAEDEPTSEVTIRVDAARALAGRVDAARAPAGRVEAARAPGGRGPQTPSAGRSDPGPGRPPPARRRESEEITETAPKPPASLAKPVPSRPPVASSQAAREGELAVPAARPAPPTLDARGSSSPPSVIVRGTVAPEPTTSPAAPRAWIAGLVVGALMFAGAGVWLWLGDTSEASDPSLAPHGPEPWVGEEGTEPGLPEPLAAELAAPEPEDGPHFESVPELVPSPPSVEPQPAALGESGPALERPPRSTNEAAHAPRAASNPTSTAAKTSGSSDRCEGVTKAAERAAARREWELVLTHTAQRKCWSSARARQRLEVSAYANTGNWSKCVAAGDGTRDPDIQRLVDACRDAQP